MPKIHKDFFFPLLKLNLNDLNSWRIWTVQRNLSASSSRLSLGYALGLIIIRMLKVQHVENELHYEKIE